MNTEPHRKISLDEAKLHINQIDFSQIRNKLVTKDGWLEGDTIICERLYKNFLFLLKKYRDEYKIPPSEEIDEFWHAHILDTERYHEDCLNIFGKYLHHPRFGSCKVSYCSLAG